MARQNSIIIPQTLEAVCDPSRFALLVYDMQVGILNQIKDTDTLLKNVLEVVEAARNAGVRVFYSRHISLPKEVMGVFQTRQAMLWQRVTAPGDVKPWFLPDNPGTALIPALDPLPSEVIFDKITMSAFEGTFLDIALRDCGINALAIVGVAIEIGIEPTVRHGSDRGFISVVVTDACGSGNSEAAQRSLEGFRFTGDAILTDTASLCGVLNAAAHTAENG